MSHGRPLDLIELGHVIDAYGLQGWVKVRGASIDSPALLQAKTWWLCKSLIVRGRFSSANHIANQRDERKNFNSDSNLCNQNVAPNQLQPFRVLKAKHHAGFVVAALEGVVSRDEALTLKSCAVQVSRSLFPPTMPDEFYWVDLIGCRVLNQEGVFLGQVDDIVDHGAHPILIANKHWIPFVPIFVSKVDLPARQITVDWQPDYAN